MAATPIMNTLAIGASSTSGTGSNAVLFSINTQVAAIIAAHPTAVIAKSFTQNTLTNAAGTQVASIAVLMVQYANNY
jgi:hypothetical protein